MVDAIPLCYDQSFDRWCKPEDIDRIIQLIIDLDVELPKNVLTISFSFAEPREEGHFVKGSRMYVTFSSRPCNNIRRLNKDKLTHKQVTYYSFMQGMVEFVERWQHDIPFKGSGQIDVDQFSIIQLKRLLKEIVE